jgi:hypothetical protein
MRRPFGETIESLCNRQHLLACVFNVRVGRWSLNVFAFVPPFETTGRDGAESLRGGS